MPKGLTKNRDHTWDALKFVLVVFVILGHWLECDLEVDGLNQIVYNFRALFTIPLFVFISGYFSRKKEWHEFFRDIIHIAETYCIVQILYVVTSILLQGKHYGMEVLFIPNHAAWYLFSLIIWRAILQSLSNKILNSNYLLVICLLISLIAGFVPLESAFSFQRTLGFLPFFIAGFKMKGKIDFGRKSVLLNSICIIFIIGVFVLCYFCFNQNLSYIVHLQNDYFSPPYPEYRLFFARGVFLVFAFLTSICVLVLFPLCPHESFLSKQGRDSLFYYVFHVIVMRIIIICLKQVSMTFPIMLLLTICSVLILYFLNKISILRMLLNPISSIIRMNNRLDPSPNITAQKDVIK